MKTGSGDTSRSFRSASNAVQSTVRNVVTCGIAPTSVSRRAISRRTGVMGSTPVRSSPPPLAASRSSAVIRPPGPVPVIVARSTPRSFASLRTAGVAAALTGEVATSGRDDAPRRRHRRTSTSAEPTGTASPHRRVQRRHRPANGDGISTDGLRRLDLDERLVQRRPARLRRRATRRSRPPRGPRPGPAARRRARPSVLSPSADGLDDPLDARQVVLLERGRRVRHVPSRHARDGRLQVIERLLHHARRDLGADPERAAAPRARPRRGRSRGRSARAASGRAATSDRRSTTRAPIPSLRERVRGFEAARRPSRRTSRRCRRRRRAGPAPSPMPGPSTVRSPSSFDQYRAFGSSTITGSGSAIASGAAGTRRARVDGHDDLQPGRVHVVRLGALAVVLLAR